MKTVVSKSQTESRKTNDANHKHDNTDVSSEALLSLQGISKRFPGVLALSDVDFELQAGEVHILFGENGAGKSTLISILAGVYKPTSGLFFYKNQLINFESVQQARQLGISAVFQELSLIEQLTVEQNLFLGDEITGRFLLNKNKQLDSAREILSRLGFTIDVAKPITQLSRAEQQMVEIAKAFRANLSVLILDEPTASLTEKETRQLFDLIDQIKKQGVGIIYITHRMSEIRRIGDRITVLRDGQLISTANAKTTTENELIKLMSGKVINQIFPVINFKPTKACLQVRHLRTVNGHLQDASLDAHSGEVIGLAGLLGCGKSEVMRACFGLERTSSGQIIFNEENIQDPNPRKMLQHGLFYTPPDRRTEGLALERSCKENITMSSLKHLSVSKYGLLKRPTEKKLAQQLAEKLQLQPLNIERNVEYFSGGNQQKVLLAKSLINTGCCYVFDEPTVGVDVVTRSQIYHLIKSLCEAGAAVIVVSSDMAEILHLSHRVYVLNHGKIQAELSGRDINQENLLKHFFNQEELACSA